MKRCFNKELKMTKDDEEDFETSVKCQICDNAYVDGGVISLNNIGVQHIDIVISILN